jgi:phage I-like protein
MKSNLKNSEQYVIVRATDLSAVNGVPMEIMVAPYGKWKGYQAPDGTKIEFEITPELCDGLIAYHRSLKERFPLRDLVIDYEHQTENDVEAPAAGFMFSDVFKKADGVYARVKQWTKRAEEYLLNGEYRYASPVLIFNGFDKETGEKVPLRLKNLALTNEPFLDNYKPISAKDGGTPTLIYLTDSPQLINGGNTMLQEIMKLLGLDANATIDAVKAKLDEWKKAATDAASTVAAKYTSAMKELGLKDDASVEDVRAFALKHTTILTELGLKASDTVDHIKSVIVTAKGSGTQQVDLKEYVKKSDFETLQLQMKTRDVNEAISAAVQKGKIAPASVEEFKKIALRDLTQFNDLMAKVPDYTAVPLQEIIAKNVTSAASKEPDANTIEVAGKAGVSAEDIKKFGGR